MLSDQRGIRRIAWGKVATAYAGAGQVVITGRSLQRRREITARAAPVQARSGHRLQAMGDDVSFEEASRRCRVAPRIFHAAGVSDSARFFETPTPASFRC